MNASRRSILVALLFVPLSISAQELTLGVSATGGHDSNVFSTPIEEVDDYSFRIAPNALLKDREGDLQWSFLYKPSFEYFTDNHQARGWDHLAEGKLKWQINPTTHLEVSDRFGRYRSTSQFNQVINEGTDDGIVDVTRTTFGLNRNVRNTFDASLTHRLSPARSLIFSVGQNLTDYSSDRIARRDTLSATGRYMQMVSRRNALGGGVSYRRSSFDSTTAPDGTVLRNSQSTDFYNLFGSWQHQFDPTLTMSVSLGPTWVKGESQDDIVRTAENQLLFPLVSVEGENKLVRASSCPTEDGTLILTGDCDVIDQDLTPAMDRAVRTVRTDLEHEGSVPSRSNESLTYFANVTLSKRWEQWNGSLSYRRQQSDSSGLGSSTVADIVTGILDWKPSPRWRSTLRVSLTRQSQATEGIQMVTAVMATDLTPVFGPGFEDVAEAFALRSVKIDQDADVLTLSLRLGVRYRLTKRTTLLGELNFWDQNRGGGTGVGRDYDRLRVHFGVEYQFEPIRL